MVSVAVMKHLKILMIVSEKFMITTVLTRTLRFYRHDYKAF